MTTFGEKFYGRRITSAAVSDDELVLGLDDGKRIRIFDNGQSCCESRYLICDDDVSSLIGAAIVRIEDKGIEESDEDGECHEVCFVEVATDKGSITLCTHNDHNGYYGGFDLEVSEVAP